MQSNNDITCTRQVHKSGVSCVLSFAAIASLFVRGTLAGTARHAHIPCSYRSCPPRISRRVVHVFFVKGLSLINFPRAYYMYSKRQKRDRTRRNDLDEPRRHVKIQAYFYCVARASYLPRPYSRIRQVRPKLQLRAIPVTLREELEAP